MRPNQIHFNGLSVSEEANDRLRMPAIIKFLHFYFREPINIRCSNIYSNRLETIPIGAVVGAVFRPAAPSIPSNKCVRAIAIWKLWQTTWMRLGHRCRRCAACCIAYNNLSLFSVIHFSTPNYVQQKWSRSINSNRIKLMTLFIFFSFSFFSVGFLYDSRLTGLKIEQLSTRWSWPRTARHQLPLCALFFFFFFHFVYYFSWHQLLYAPRQLIWIWP